MIGQRLKLARTAAGFSLRGLEERIGRRVTAQAIGKYERDESMPSSGVLIALADALSVPVDYLVGEQEMALESVEFRKKRITGRREEAQVEAKVLHLLERYLMVEEFLGLTSINWDKPREAPYPVVGDPGEADRAAHSLRLYWGLGLDPIPNLVELMEEHGIKVLSCAPREDRRAYGSGASHRQYPGSRPRCQRQRLGRAAAVDDGPRTWTSGPGGRPEGR